MEGVKWLWEADKGRGGGVKSHKKGVKGRRKKYEGRPKSIEGQREAANVPQRR